MKCKTWILGPFNKKPPLQHFPNNFSYSQILHISLSHVVNVFSFSADSFFHSHFYFFFFGSNLPHKSLSFFHFIFFSSYLISPISSSIIFVFWWWSSCGCGSAIFYGLMAIGLTRFWVWVWVWLTWVFGVWCGGSWQFCGGG